MKRSQASIPKKCCSINNQLITQCEARLTLKDFQSEKEENTSSLPESMRMHR